MLRCRGQHRLGENFGWVYPHVGNENGEVANDTGIPLYSYIYTYQNVVHVKEFQGILSAILASNEWDYAPTQKSGFNRATV